MVQLEVAARGAATTVGTDEGALTGVASIYLANHCARPSRRQLTHDSRHVRLGRELRNQNLHLTLALRPSALQDLDVIRLRQLRRQQPDSGQMQLVPLQHLQNQRKLPSHLGNAQAHVRLILGHMQRFDGVLEHRRERLLPIQPARLDLPEMQHQPRSDAAILPHQPMQPRHQRDIVQAGDLCEIQIMISHAHPLKDVRSVARQFARP
ncbi:MAG TPA: hypothetical protein VJV78_08360 [Polyangiales bacterium]|nr:hypothetical protein [Polyangiales bacterium]